MTPQPSTIYSIRFQDFATSLPLLLQESDLAAHLPSDRPIIIKPNLVEALTPPITTPVALIAALVDYLREKTNAPLIIAEGTGAIDYDTMHCFEKLGYVQLAEEKRVELLDLNTAPSIHLKNESCQRWPEMYLPEIAMQGFLLSVPVLKVHTLAGVTLSMKNMMGLPPPSHYRQGNSWGKSSFHQGMQEAVADLNRYRCPDYVILDATVGMAKAHLWGPTCDPPINILAAGADPVAMDGYGTTLLGKDWQDIGHICMVNGELGNAEGAEIIEV